MKNQNKTETGHELSLSGLGSGVQIRKEQADELDARSQPLQSNYNSTFIVLVLSIAVLLAIILLVWL